MTKYLVSARLPRVTLSWESIWRLPAIDETTRLGALEAPRGRVVICAYSVYCEDPTDREFEAYVVPILRNVAASRTRGMLTLVESASRFDASRLRNAIRVARSFGLHSLVEIDGVWSTAMLEMLADATPGYLRLNPDVTLGASVIPEQFQTLVRLAEFARARDIPLVARNPSDEFELDALRVGGIELVQFATLPTESRAGESTDMAARVQGQEFGRRSLTLTGVPTNGRVGWRTRLRESKDAPGDGVRWHSQE